MGVGLYDQVVKTNVTGISNTIGQMGIGFMAAASALVWRPDPFALGVEARLVGLQFPADRLLPDLWSVGLTGRWDFVRN